MGVYVAALSAAAAKVGAWDLGLLNDTIVWFVTVAIALLMKLKETYDTGFFRSGVKRAVGAAVFAEAFIGLYALPLPFELVLVPVLVVLGGMSAVAEREHYASVKTLVSAALTLIGCGYLLFIAVSFIGDVGDIDWSATARAVAMPAWLTIAILPYIYALGVWSAYQMAFGLMDLATEPRNAPWTAKAALVWRLRLHASEIAAFRSYWCRRLAETSAFKAGLAVIDEFRVVRHRELLAAKAAEQRLVEFTGVDGVDEAGRRLDQREFGETRSALFWLHTAQTGWYDRRGRYRDDLLSLLEPFAKLPAEHGIELVVADDGQAWYAWRRTVSGWCFAIGAGGTPPDQWLYDGPVPPTGFPGRDPCWGERWGLEAVNWG